MSEHDWLLRAQSLEYAYPGGLLAVQGFNLEVNVGEIVSLVGPSGCGKSTVLSLVSGQRALRGGSLTWNEPLFAGDGIGKRRPKRRRLSMVFQHDTLFPWRTVEENIAFGLDYLDLNDAERERRIGAMLELARLRDYRKAYPRELSGGMRRRVALLTGVAPLPHVLLLDEPFSALDEPTRVGVHQDLLEIIQELKLTVILVTHDIAEAISLSDRIFVLSHRPAAVSWSTATNLGWPRDMQGLRSSPAYAEAYAQTWRELWRAIDAQPAASSAARALGG